MNVPSCLLCLSLIALFASCTGDIPLIPFRTKDVSVEWKLLVSQYNSQFHSAIPVPSDNSVVIFRNVAVQKGGQFSIGTFFKSLTNEINSQIERYLVGNKSKLLAEMYNSSIGYSNSVTVQLEEQSQINYLRQLFGTILERILSDNLRDVLTAEKLGEYLKQLKNPFDELIIRPVQFKNIPIVQRNSTVFDNLNEYLKKRGNEIWVNGKLKSKEIKDAWKAYFLKQTIQTWTELRTAIFQSFNGVTPFDSKLKAFITTAVKFDPKELNEEYKKITGKTVEITLGEVKNLAFYSNDTNNYPLDAATFLQTILQFSSKNFEEQIEGRPNEFDCSKYNSLIGYNEVRSLYFTTPNELKQVKLLFEVRLSKLLNPESLSVDFEEAIKEVFRNESELIFSGIPINPAKSAYDNLSLHLLNPNSHAVIQPVIEKFNENKTQRNLNKVKVAWLSLLKGETVVIENQAESDSSTRKPIMRRKKEKTDTESSSDIGWIIVLIVASAGLITICVIIYIKGKPKKEKKAANL